MNDTQIGRLAIGILLALAGILVVIFHRSIKEGSDKRNSKPFPLGFGEMWTGKYTRAGVIITYAMIILIGLVLTYLGIVYIVRAFTI